MKTRNALLAPLMVLLGLSATACKSDFPAGRITSDAQGNADLGRTSEVASEVKSTGETIGSGGSGGNPGSGGTVGGSGGIAFDGAADVQVVPVSPDAPAPSLEAGSEGSQSDKPPVGLDRGGVDVAVILDVATDSVDVTRVPVDASGVDQTATPIDGSPGNCTEQVLLYDEIVLGAYMSTVNSLAFSPDGQFLASGIEHTGVIWRLSDGAQAGGFGDMCPAAIYAVSYFPVGQTIAGLSCGGYFGMWGAGDAFMPDRLDFFGAYAISPDGQIVADGNNPIRLWSVASRAVVRSMSGGGATSLAFSPDGATLASGNTDGAIRLWDVASGSELASLAIGAPVSRVKVAISPDSRLIAALSTAGLQLWSLLDHQGVGTIVVDPLATDFAFTPDGKYIATSGTKVGVYSVDQRVLVYELGEEKANVVAISPDGKRVAASGEMGRPVNLFCLRAPTQD